MSKLKLQSEASVPTEYGEFDILAFAKNSRELMPHVVLKSKFLDTSKPVLIRIHSECMTGDVFQSLKCDCKDQLHVSMNQVFKENGILIYLRQEGRGIGLIEKLKAYNLQDEGYDTVEANLKLGHQADERDYSDAIDILKYFKISEVKVLTNNPEKIHYLKEYGIKVTERIPIVLPSQKYSKKYFDTKAEKMGHIFY